MIVTGPPGAGKSTVAKLLADSTSRSVLVAGDAFFGFLANGAIAPWLPESHDQNTVVTRAAGKATGEFVAGGFVVVYDGVIGPWFLDTFVTMAGLTEVDYAVLLPTVDCSLCEDNRFRNDACLREEHVCLESITPDTVLARLDRLLERHQRAVPVLARHHPGV